MAPVSDIPAAESMDEQDLAREEVVEVEVAEEEGAEGEVPEEEAAAGAEEAQDEVVEDYVPGPAAPKSPRGLNAAFRRQSSIKRIHENKHIVQFNDWAASIDKGWERLHEMFMKEAQNPAGAIYIDKSHQGSRGITKKRWLMLLADKGFTDKEAASNIFDEIAQETLDQKRACAVNDGLILVEEPEITLSQFKRFEKRTVNVISTLVGREENSHVSRFLKHLAKVHGCVLRAWRIDLDVRGNGRVGYIDFINGCRKMGLGVQAKNIWGNLRQGDDMTTLEFHEIGGIEAENMESFAEVVWTNCGYDMKKAWRLFDPNNLNVTTYDEFAKALKKLNFLGDAKLVFKGMDLSGLGRLKYEDLEYISKISRIAQRKRAQTSKGAVADLVNWANREIGGGDLLVLKLGLTDEQPTTMDLLASRLTALGFDGNSQEVAVRAARLEGRDTISRRAMVALLNGSDMGKITGRITNGKRAKSAAPRTGGKKSPWWDITVDYSEVNQFRHRVNKMYFTAFDCLERHEYGRVECSGAEDAVVGSYDPRGSMYICKAKSYTPFVRTKASKKFAPCNRVKAMSMTPRARTATESTEEPKSPGSGPSTPQKLAKSPRLMKA